MIINIDEYKKIRNKLLENGCEYILNLEHETTKIVLNAILDFAQDLKHDFDTASDLKPFWEKYAPVQRGHKPRGEAYPWGEVGEKVAEGYLYSRLPNYFEVAHFPGITYGHDIRFATNKVFLQIDAKSTGPTDNPNEVVSSPNQVTGNGVISEEGVIYNDTVYMKGPRVTREFTPELPPFYVINGKVLPNITMYLKIVYRVEELGTQPLDYLELITVPNGLALFDGPRLIDQVKGLLTPGKDETKVLRKRTRIKLDPLSQLDYWRCTKIVFDEEGPKVT